MTNNNTKIINSTEFAHTPLLQPSTITKPAGGETQTTRQIALQRMAQEKQKRQYEKQNAEEDHLRNAKMILEAFCSRKGPLPHHHEMVECLERGLMLTKPDAERMLEAAWAPNKEYNRIAALYLGELKAYLGSFEANLEPNKREMLATLQKDMYLNSSEAQKILAALDFA